MLVDTNKKYVCFKINANEYISPNLKFSENITLIPVIGCGACVNEKYEIVRQYWRNEIDYGQFCLLK